MSTPVMMRPTLAALAFATLLSVSAAPQAQDEFTAPLTALAASEIAAFAADPVLIDAINAQNAMSSSYDQAKIDELDAQWRAEVGAASRPLIDATLANAASQYLVGVQEESLGKYTEIFAMDAKGLNVGQSAVTSDYWQGDEGKWQNTYLVGDGAIDIGDVEQDESTQTFQSQVSIPVLDETGTPIGAITFGVNIEYL